MVFVKGILVMDKKHLKHNMEFIRERNNSRLGIPTKSGVSKDIVQKRIKYQQQRELREYEDSWKL